MDKTNSLIIPLPNGELSVSRNPDDAFAGFDVCFITKNGDVIPIVLVECKKETNQEKIDVYTYEDEANDDFTRTYSLDINELIKSTL